MGPKYIHLVHCLFARHLKDYRKECNYAPSRTADVADISLGLRLFEAVPYPKVFTERPEAARISMNAQDRDILTSLFMDYVLGLYHIISHVYFVTQLQHILLHKYQLPLVILKLILIGEGGPKKLFMRLFVTL